LSSIKIAGGDFSGISHSSYFKFAGSFGCGDAIALLLKHYVSLKLSDRAEYIQK
jgi:uncharacterized membrane-anchored protein YitT (DUF2179 family)